MKNHLLAFALFAAVAGTAVSLDAQQDFRWSGTVAQGDAIEVRGVNGSVRAVASNDATVRVEATRRARRSDAESVRIEVVEHAGGVTVCAVYPTPARASQPNECRRGGGPSSVQDNDVQVDFTVHVPAGVRFVGATVNGAVEARALRSDVEAATVNGAVRVSTSGAVSRVSTVNGSIELELPAGTNADLHASTVNGRIDSDFPVSVSGRIGPRTVRGTIGSGGPELRASTVNGSIQVRRLGS